MLIFRKILIQFKRSYKNQVLIETVRYIILDMNKKSLNWRIKLENFRIRNQIIIRSFKIEFEIKKRPYLFFRKNYRIKIIVIKMLINLIRIYHKRKRRLLNKYLISRNYKIDKQRAYKNELNSYQIRIKNKTSR